VHNLDGGSRDGSYGVQQKDVASEPLATPMGAPPPDRVQEPASATVGELLSFTGSGGEKAVHGLGAERVPPEPRQSVSTAPAAMVHVAPVGLAHSHDEQPRSSSTPA
jgi:hypothetical protein